MLNKHIFILATFLLLYSTNFAIEIERFENLNTKDGLSQSYVSAVFCDSRGFLWVGTWDGLNRYDGFNFITYQKKRNDAFSLSSNRIIKIWEDLNKFIWVETHDGHYHYLDINTNKFYSFPKSDDFNSGKNLRISSFLEVSRNNIWLGTDNSGVYYLSLDNNGIYKSQHFRALNNEQISNDNIRFITQDTDSTIWIGTANGVNKVIRSKNAENGLIFQHFLIDHDFTTSVSINDKIWFVSANKGLISYDITTQEFNNEYKNLVDYKISVLQKSKTGNLIVGTINGGLHIINPNSNTSINYFKNQSIKEVFQDSQGVLWLVTNQTGISRINLNNSIEEHYELVPQTSSYKFIEELPIFFEDNAGKVWIGTHGGGLAAFDSDLLKFQFYRHNPGNPFSLSSNIVNSITQDKSGLMWIGNAESIGGLNKYIPTNPLFEHIKIKKDSDKKRESYVRSIFQDDKNNIWVGTKSGHIAIYDQSFKLTYEFHKTTHPKSNIPQRNIYTITQDKEGFIWLGSKGNGISVSKFPLKHYKSYSDISFYSYKNLTNDSTSLSHNFVYSILHDNNGVTWIGTHGGGLNKVMDRSPSKLFCRHYNTTNSNLSNNNIRNIYQDKNQRIWLATTYGLNLLDKNTNDSAIFEVFTHSFDKQNSLIYNDVVHIFEDSSGKLWFGTFGGVSYFIDDNDLNKGFRSFTTNDGLINDVITGIAEDTEGYLWFSTQNGLSRYNFEDNNFDNFDNNNGLYFSNLSENTCITFESGQLGFGNVSGLVLINPNKLTSTSYSPPISFTGFSLFNKEVKLDDEESPLKKPIDFTDEIILKHDQSSFSIEYAALSYFDPKKNQYSYILENYDEIWYDVKNERKATYTKVPPGDYIFKLKAANWDGTWNETPRELKITIMRPWWGTILAYLIYIMLILALGEVLRRTYMNYYRLQTDLKVEKRINQIKLQFFTNISHEIRTPLTLILGPLEDLKKSQELPKSVEASLNIMNRNGKRMLRLVNQLLDFRKIQNQKMNLKVKEVEMCTFINEICQNFEQLAQQKNINFTYPKTIQKEYAWIDKSKIDSVIFNVLSNAFKFTENNKAINLSIEKTSDAIYISVKDEGKGIAKKKIPEIFQRFNTLSTDEINFAGTGIGLAYSYELMKLHGGDIRVESQLGQGSVFTIIIPLGKDHFTEEKTTFVEQQKTQDYSHAKEYNLEEKDKPDSTIEKEIKKEHKIVIVEDNLEVVDYLQSILKLLFITYHANNGIEGIKLIQEKHPDLIITDVMMPEMDGITMTKIIKDDIEISHIPVVMLTAKSAINDQIEGIETGAEAYLLKPFNSKHLITVVNTMLKQRKILSQKLNTGDKNLTTDIKITNNDEEFLKKTIKIIEENYQDTEFNVSELIAKSFLGRTVFFNKIKGLTGLSPVEFLRKIRLQIAAKHILENKSGVAETAYLCGFNSVKYFTKCFKAEHGVTPSEYKLQNSKN